jgi:hypothetical protein
MGMMLIVDMRVKGRERKKTKHSMCKDLGEHGVLGSERPSAWLEGVTKGQRGGAGFLPAPPP